MSKILDNLYLGSYNDAKNPAFLKKAEITHIVTVGVELQALFPQQFRYLYVPAYDHPAFQLSPYFDQIADFIHNAIDKEKGKVFVHCQMGISRSTTSVICYLIKYHRMHPLEAGSFVKSRRAIVYPNPGFLRQLDAYAKKLGVVENKTKFQARASSTMGGGFFVSKKEEDNKKPEVKTLAMTSSSWRPVTVKQLEMRSPSMASSLNPIVSPAFNPSMTISKWKPSIKEEAKIVENDKLKDKDYCCKSCGTKLFESQNIEHDANTTSHLCTTIYIKYMPWIGYSKNTSAKIFCPNGRCNAIIGFSNQNGGKCPCGKRINLMNGIYPSKVGIPKNKIEAGKAW